VNAYQWAHLACVTLVAGALVAGIVDQIISINAMLPG